MKVVILAGGFGTRISEESHLIPKPMIRIGNMPIIWHIMKHFSHYGHNDFIICAGYKQYVIKEFFANYYLHTSDVTYDFNNGNNLIIHKSDTEKWKVTIVDTGLDTMTGGRLKRIREYLDDSKDFMLTYGDGVSNINLKDLLEFHSKNNSLLTTSAIQPGGRFGSLDIDEYSKINNFIEKSREAGGWINAGFMVSSIKTLSYISNDSTIFEKEPLEKLALEKKLSAFKHEGFWKAMDTLRDKTELDNMWLSGKAPWKVW